MPTPTDDPAGDRERKRLEALRAYAILDTDREPEFDDIVAVAARACDTPIAHINFLDRHRQWFKAEIGIGRRELPATAPLCAATLDADEIFVVPDTAALPGGALRDFAGPAPRFYAGVPLKTPDGVAIGTLCVLDHRPRTLDEQQLFILKALGRSVMAQLDLRRAVAERDRAFARERRAEAERRAAARSLRDSRERSDAALASGLVGFVDWDAGTGLVRGDARFAGFLGLPPEAAAAGLDPGALLARVRAEDRDRVGREVGAAFAEGRDFVTEFRVAPEGGTAPRSALWLLLGGRCYRAEDGAPRRLAGIAIDVTASRSAEAERDAERLRFKAVLDAAPVGILFAEAPSGRVVGQNPRADEIFGHKLIPTEAVEQHRDWILHRPDRTRLELDRYPLARAITRGETSAGEEYLYRRGDDTLAWVQLTAAPIRDAAGGIAGGVVCIEDIGARKDAEAALRRMNETLEAAVAARTHELDSIWRHARDMLCVARLDGTFVRLNPAWAETLGRTPEDLLDTSSIALVHPDDLWRTTSALALLAEGLTVPAFENRYRHRDGSYRWFSWSAVPHDGLIYCIVRDVTDEKDAAAALAKAEDALRQSQKMEAVGQLTGGIAHDFNNLLTGITGALDLMQRRIAQGRTGDVGRYVEIAVRSADRAAALTHRLLAFSRRQPLDPRPTDMGRLVGTMEDLLRRTTGEAIGFEVSLAEGLWPTLCDPHQLENALLNLVINARDAMPDGGRLAIETGNVTVGEAAPDGPAPGDYAALTVADTGGGMAPEVAARAFDPFFTTKPMGQGTGLGLSMVYGFVRQSEGHVAIDTAPGRGTRVRILLPRFAGAAAGEAARPGPAASLRARAAETVLVVEDELSVRDLVVEVLADLGYRALQAPDGPSGLKVLQGGERVDLLVTDVGLPGMNGRQLAEQGRRLRPGLRVLFITGYAEDATFGEGRLDPGLQMLTKPFTIDALAGRIRAMIEAG
ncbi:PAS domain S-box protein [Lichenibacterium dinghuense]|uniref:PAS domain S-box protein n=1 Tax=Lichenibacterium dinghuense TaxID=2895977 RepID=UPI001F24FA92|nr:PAS domain S-box protein [Lichenibacterium sp. 6Y81]